MREIKFRAWNRATKRFLFWKSKDHQFFGPSMLIAHPDHLEDFEQFTGLHDKNGVEIYEGDIVRGVHGGACLIEWHRQDAHFHAISGEVLIDPSSWDDREVIGDIHENPELLR